MDYQMMFFYPFLRLYLKEESWNCLSCSWIPNRVHDEAWPVRYESVKPQYRCGMMCPESAMTLPKGHKSANDWSESSFDFLNFLVCYSQKNRSVLVDLFNMNCQPQNPADWKKLFWDLKPVSDFRPGITEPQNMDWLSVWWRSMIRFKPQTIKIYQSQLP